MKDLNTITRSLVFALFVMSSSQIWAYQINTQAPDPPITLNLTDLLGEQALTQTGPNTLADNTSEEFRPTPSEGIIQAGIYRIVFEPGSSAHRITGISSVVSMAVGYLGIGLIF